jgi:transposase-like protein
MVVGIRQRDGQLRFAHVKTVNKKTVSAVIEANIDPAVEHIYTDSSVVYDFAMRGDLEAKHRSVNHSIEWIVPGTDIHTNSIESAFSLLKRGITGSFHWISTKHLHRYLTEFEYRFNARKDADRFGKTLKAMLDAPAMPYRELVSSVSSAR